MRDALLPLATAVETWFDAWKSRLADRLGPPGAPFIQTYRGFGTADAVTVQGRVLEDPRLRKPQDDDSVLDNVLATVRRMETDELPGVTLRVAFGGAEVETVTDEEGYFSATLAPVHPLDAGERWHTARVALARSPRHAEGTEASAPAEILVPPASAQFGLISDIDDTILQTGATSFLRMVRTTLTENALTRLPFEGVAGFYRALAHGTLDTDDNPVFYVSSSPWNLYDLLVDFMASQGIPRGPILLRDLGLDATKFIKAPHDTHKTAAITRILDTYPDLPFFLVGDSGQHDPEIYAAIARAHPGRIRCIYIRDVASDARDAEVAEIAAKLAAEHDVEMVLAADSLQAARHAEARGWIVPADLPDVAAEKAKDEQAGHES